MSAQRKKTDSDPVEPAEAVELNPDGTAVEDDVEAGSQADEPRDTAPLERRSGRAPVKVKIDQNPAWWAPVMVGLMLLGLVWLVVYYLSNFSLPIKALGNWNMAVGFALIMVGFFMTTNWK